MYRYRSVRQEAVGVKVVVSAGTAEVVNVVIVDSDAMMLVGDIDDHSIDLEVSNYCIEDS